MHQTDFWRQCLVLRRRHALITLQDRKNLLILLAQAPVIAFLIGLVPWDKAEPDPAADPESDLKQVVLFLMVISAVWCGCSNATKGIVKELPIYKRERAIGLETLTYPFSKVTVLSMLCAVQRVALILLISPLTGADIPFLGSFLVIYLPALAGTMMGLVVSALVDNTDEANATTPLLLIPQVVLARRIVPSDLALVKFVSAVTIIACWEFDGMVNPRSRRVPPRPSGRLPPSAARFLPN